MRRLANSARRRRSKKIRRVVSRFSNTKSLSFDGVNDVAAWASGTTLTNLIGAGDFTISFWAKRSDWVVSNAAQVALLTNAITTSPYAIVALGVTAGTGASDADLRGGIRMNVVGNGNTYLDDVTPNLDTISGVSDNTWIHVAYVSTEGANSRSGQFYINGAAVTTTANTASDDVDFSGLDAGLAGLSETKIFGNWYTFQQQKLDEIAFFNTAHSASTISDIYNGGTPRDETSTAGLVGYWRMEDNGNDSSSNNNRLTVTGATFTTDTP